MGLILDILIAALMLVTIAFCYRLSKRIAVLNSSRNEMAGFLNEFNESILRAERNINELKSMGTQVDETLKGQLKKARFLANDLSFLTEKGETIAENLDRKLSEVRSLARISQPHEQNGYRPQRQEPQFNSISYPRKSGTAQRESEQQPTPYMMSPSKKQALESILEEIARRRSINKQIAPEEKK
jgi:hypothetical protein